MQDHSVILGGDPVTVRAPKLQLHAIRADVREAVSQKRNFSRILAACLGACWADKKKLAAKYHPDVLAFGGEVMDELIGRGATEDEIATAGLQCWRLLRGVPPLEEEKADEAGEGGGTVEDFSAASEGGRTS